MKRYAPYVLCGLMFGFALSRAGATNFEFINGMFRFSNPQLYFIIGTAFVLNLIAFQLLARSGMKGSNGLPMNLPRRTFNPGTIPGALIFGIGWAITGTCPSTAMIQLGEGHLAALVSVAGIFAGAWIYPRIHARFFSWPGASCAE